MQAGVDSAKTSIKLCLYCFGSGVDMKKNPPVPCYVCHGKGQYRDYVVCALCYGTGKATMLFAQKVDDSCPNCQGSGKSLIHETGRSG